MTAYLGYHNFFDQVSSFLGLDEDASHPFAHSQSDDLTEVWKFGVSGSAEVWVQGLQSQNVDYMALYGHNLASISYTVEYYSFSNYYTISSGTIPSDDVFFVRFYNGGVSQGSSRWRITFSGLSGNEYISRLQLGKALQLNPLRVPFTPPSQARNKDVINNASIEHQLLSKVVRERPYDVLIPQTLVQPDWIDANYQAMADHINEHPFFFNWDGDRDDALFCWTTESVEQPRYSRYQYQDFAIRAKGFR